MAPHGLLQQLRPAYKASSVRSAESAEVFAAVRELLKEGKHLASDLTPRHFLVVGHQSDGKSGVPCLDLDSVWPSLVMPCLASEQALHKLLDREHTRCRPESTDNERIRAALIEALMGFLFNHIGNGCMTRRPLKMLIAHDDTCDTPQCTLVRDGAEQAMPLEALQEHIASENKRLADEDSFNAEDIIISIRYELCADIVITDTPGDTLRGLLTPCAGSGRCSKFQLESCPAAPCSTARGYQTARHTAMNSVFVEHQGCPLKCRFDRRSRFERQR